jgi:hypothetical protein
MEELIARAKEMCSPPQPCIYDKLAWRKVVMALVEELEAARKDAYAAGLRRAAEVCQEQIDRSFKQYGDGGDERLIRFGCLRAANAIKQEIECPS